MSPAAKRRDLTASTRALAAARAWARAVEEGRVGKVGGDRQSKKASPQSAGMVLDPERYFSRLYDAGEKYTQQAYALVTRDPVAAKGVERGENLKAAYDALIAREGESNSEAAKRTRPDRPFRSRARRPCAQP